MLAITGFQRKFLVPLIIKHACIILYHGWFTNLKSPNFGILPLLHHWSPSNYGRFWRPLASMSSHASPWRSPASIHLAMWFTWHASKKCDFRPENQPYRFNRIPILEIAFKNVTTVIEHLDIGGFSMHSRSITTEPVGGFSQQNIAHWSQIA